MRTAERLLPRQPRTWAQLTSTLTQGGETVKLTVFFALLLTCGAAAARDVGQIPSHPDPKISTWFRTAMSQNGTSCCDEADGYREGVAVKIARDESIIFRSWWVASDGYHLSLVDPQLAPWSRSRGRTAS